MIFPWPLKFNFKMHFATTLLIGLTVLVHGLLSEPQRLAQREMENILSDHSFLRTQGRLFADILKARSNHNSEFDELLLQSDQGRNDAREILGKIAFRQVDLKSQVERLPASTVDNVAMKVWQKRTVQWTNARERHPYFELGFFSYQSGWQSFFSYQFVHGSWSHAFMNIIILFLLGTYLEPLIGSVALLVIFLLGGAIGAAAFAWHGGAQLVPMVGGSASVMAMMGALLAQGFTKKMNYFWVIPTRQLWGIVSLPVWLLATYLLCMDLAGLIENISWLGGGVAHAAHVGGLFSGFILAVILRWAQNLYALYFPSRNVVPKIV